MKLQYFFGCILAAASLAVCPEIGLAHGGGGHGFGGGHAFGGFTGRPGFSGMRGFSTGGFSGRGDHGRFGDRGFRGRDRDFHHRRFGDFDGEFFDFGSTGFGYPDYPFYDPYPYYTNNGYLSLERTLQEELGQLGYYYVPIESLKSKAHLIPDVRKGEKLDSSAIAFAFQGF